MILDRNGGWGGSDPHGSGDPRPPTAPRTHEKKRPPKSFLAWPLQPPSASHPHLGERGGPLWGTQECAPPTVLPSTKHRIKHAGVNLWESTPPSDHCENPAMRNGMTQSNCSELLISLVVFVVCCLHPRLVWFSLHPRPLGLLRSFFNMFIGHAPSRPVLHRKGGGGHTG